MADRATFTAKSRTLFGKKAKQLRRDGFVPAVVYGQRDTLHIQVNRLPLRRALRQAGSNELIDIELDGRTVTVLAREIQQHATRGDVIHVDFYEVNMAESITAEVPLLLIGEADSELRTMGQVTQLLHAVEVECLPGDLVSEIEVDITGITTPDDVIYAADVQLPKGLTLITDPEAAVTSFDYYREEEEEEEEEDLLFAPAADEVEVIGREEDEDEEAAFAEEA